MAMRKKITTCASLNATGGTMHIEKLIVPPMALTEAQVVIL